jgi:methylase of polypeptide subunit release factors
MHSNAPTVTWTEDGRTRSALWRSGGGRSPPERVVVVDDDMSADRAYRLASQGTAMLWRGDFHNARQLLSAIARRESRPRRPSRKQTPEPASPADAFHRYRMDAARRAHILGLLLIELEPDHSAPLRRAPDVRQAVTEAMGPGDAPALLPFRELLGMMGAHEWRRQGIPVPALDARIHPHYGVFAPVRQEYVELVAEAPLPSSELAFDIGTGTGVLAALLARRGVARVVATDNEPRAVACAAENTARLGLGVRIDVILADLFPPAGYPTTAPLIVCNPPWLPARAMTSLERAVYDPGGRTLRRLLEGLPRRLETDGEAWLLLSDLAERLELRSRQELTDAFEAAGLRVVHRSDAPASHPRTRAADDPLHAFRRAETVSLWRLRRS